MLLPLLFCRCNGHSAGIPKPAPRDTTITPAQAVTKLVLDSAYVEQFIAAQALGEKQATQLRNFYNNRNYQFAWFTEDGLAEQARAFWNLHEQFVDYSRDSSFVNQQLHTVMDTLVVEDSLHHLSGINIRRTELQLTQHFFVYAQYAYGGKVDPEELQWHIPRKKVDAVALLDSLVARKGRNLEEWEPVNRGYRRLKEKLLQLYTLEKGGGWDTLRLDRKGYQLGDSGPFVVALKRRLAAAGDLSPADSSREFTPATRKAVQQAQRRFGLKEDGVVGKGVVRVLNVPLERRIEQVLINLERMRWLPPQAEGKRLLANIPDFRLHLFDTGGKVMDMKIVVGKAGTNTVVFNGHLKYVVFAPYWNVPTSIVRKEILPAMQRRPGYLARNNMEITGRENGLPVIRQKPGPDNSLGLVKFLFPNSYNIYFHDTPAKTLFDQEKRTFSHGCIRLEQPFELAKWLLKDRPEWTDEAMLEAMHGDKEKWVTLAQPVPVFISYFTAWVDGEGLLHFRDDVYGHDHKMAMRMFEGIEVAGDR
jgi:murein L,D-transpeptidase YcbB/YkuD